MKIFSVILNYFKYLAGRVGLRLLIWGCNNPYVCLYNGGEYIAILSRKVDENMEIGMQEKLKELTLKLKDAIDRDDKEAIGALKEEVSRILSVIGLPK